MQINHSLTSLNFRYNQISDVGAQALATALHTNHSLTSLNLRNNKIDPISIQALADAIDTRFKMSIQQQTVLQSESEQSLFSELPGDGCILSDILNYVKIPPLKIQY
jgi:hypothetical protein